LQHCPASPQFHPVNVVGQYWTAAAVRLRPHQNTEGDYYVAMKSTNTHICIKYGRRNWNYYMKGCPHQSSCKTACTWNKDIQ